MINYNPMFFDQNQTDVINSIRDVDKEIKKENSKGSMADGNKITKLMYEQMLRGLYFSNFYGTF